MPPEPDPRRPPQAAVPQRLFALGAAAFAVVGGLSLAIATHAEVVTRMDLAGHHWAVAHRSDATISLARGLSFVGVGRFTVPALFLIGALAPRGPRPLPTRIASGAVLAGVAALGGVMGVGLNRLLERQRPLETDWAGAAAAASFPSGHTTTATLFAAGCTWALLTRVGFRRDHPRLTVVAFGALAVYALGVGCSRVWLGVHWPSDVLAGWSFALGWSAVAAATALSVARTRTGQVGMAQVGRTDAEAVAGEASEGRRA